MPRHLVLVLLVALLTACGGDGDAEPGPTVAASPSSSRTEVPVDTATPSAAPSPSRSVADRSDDEYFSFLTPSGNLNCAIYPSDDDVRKGSVRCDVRSASWALPPEPDDCGFDWVRVMTLTTRAQAGACVSDVVDVQGAETVKYGDSVRWHNIVCDSDRAGLTCTNTDNERGFTVSRSTYSLR